MCIALALAFTSTLSDAPIVDEVPHIGAGYSYIARGDMRLNPEHPPLIKDLAGIALAIINPQTSVFSTSSWTTDVNGQWQFGRDLIFESDRSPDTIKVVARLPMLMVFAFACWLVWKWARERYGDVAAIMSLTLLAFSPTILAHGRLVTTDMGAATGILAATYCFIKFLRKQNTHTFWWAVLSLGLALLAKFNTVLLGPYFVIAALIYGFQFKFRSLTAWKAGARLVALTVLLGATSFVAVVWPIYIAHTWNYPAERQRSDTASILGGYPDSLLKTTLLWASDKPIIRGAAQWGLGLAMVQQRSAGGNTIYWMGRVVRQGGPGYFPTVYFIKEPLAWWILVSVALTALIFHRRRQPDQPKRSNFYRDNLEEWMWLLWLAIYWIISIRSTLNIGVRHLLPVYPFTILLVTGRISILYEWLRHNDKQRHRIVAVVLAILLGWYAFESARIWPNYITYFNQVVGGSSGGYRFVADSNLDWGQDIKRLGVWMESNNIEKMSLDYFGWSDPSYYLGTRYLYTTGRYWKDAKDFIARNQSGGWIAISATFFLEATNKTEPGASTYRWLMDYEPTAVIGNSIFVWHLE
mgnify:FL=1